MLRNRLTELAVDQLLGELSAEDAAEYRGLRERFPDFDDAALEQSVAALQLAGDAPLEPLPERLRVRVATDATAWFASQWRAADPPAADPVAPPVAADWVRYGGWFAAAACLVLALTVWLQRPSPPAARIAALPEPPAAGVAAEPARTGSPSGPAPLPAATPARTTDAETAPDEADPEAARAQLLASRRPVVHRAWCAGGDPTGLQVSGDVIWDPRTQTGYMRFVGLPRNDPNVAQYQLWIFDGTRDDRFPVDGGVFNISGVRDGEVVAIHARLRVAVPLMFAVTIERPGGVVVSDRSRIAALANTT
jgi:hypothetical protein